MTEINPPTWMAQDENGDPACYTPQQMRQVLASLVCDEGVAEADDLEVTAPGGGMTVDVAAGSAFIEGDTIANQGMYHVVNDAPVTLAIAPSDPTDPRIDLVVATVRDSQYAGTENDWILQVIQGSPSPAPQPPPLPDNSIPLAEVLVPAGATEITQANVTDRRQVYGACGGGSAEMTVMTSSGTFEKADYPNAEAFRVRGVGGGGGGSGSASTAAGEASAASGGGGGGYFELIIPADDMPDTVTVTVGNGGNGANPGGNGSAGGDTSFGTFGTGNGGGGGNGPIASGSSPATRGAPDNGGSASCPTGFTTLGGASSGALRLSGTQALSGAGGDSQLGRGGRQVSTSSFGNPGTRYGGGGSGGCSLDGATGRNGGAGAAGVVIIEAL